MPQMRQVMGQKILNISDFRILLTVAILCLAVISPARLLAENRYVFFNSYVIEPAPKAEALMDTDNEFDGVKTVARGSDSLLLVKSGAEALGAPEIVQYNPSDPFCENLIKSGKARRCEPNFVYELDSVPNDPSFSQAWGLNQANGIDIDALRAWNLATGSRKVVVAILDTGVDYTHPDLKDNIWTNPNEIAGNGVDDDQNGYIDDIHGVNVAAGNGDPMDDHSHGTHVAGIIGAVGNNSIGTAGVNWKVSLIGVKFLKSTGRGSLFDAVRGLDYLIDLKEAHGVNIVAVNASWGSVAYSQFLKEAIDRAGKAGILITAAAGNNSNNNDDTTYYPAGYDSGNVISVAAIDTEGNLASFSNYGPESVDIAAPGVSILSTVPSGGYARMSGTSMAAPFAAGALALLKARSPSLASAVLKERLYTSGAGLTNLLGVIRTGRVVNAYRMAANITSPIIPEPAPPSFISYILDNITYQPEAGMTNEKLVMHADEMNYYKLHLPFIFPFYGQNIRDIYISPNGVIYTSQAPDDFDNRSGPKAPQNSIAALHVDLTAESPSEGVRVRVEKNRAVISWHVRLFNNPTDPISVQAQIQRDGTIKLYYDFPSRSVLATAQKSSRIGISGDTAGASLTFEGELADNLALKFTPQYSGEKKANMNLELSKGSFTGGKKVELMVSGTNGQVGYLNFVFKERFSCPLSPFTVRGSDVLFNFRMPRKKFRIKGQLQVISGTSVHDSIPFIYKPGKKAAAAGKNSFVQKTRKRTGRRQSEILCRAFKRRIFPSPE